MALKLPSALPIALLFAMAIAIVQCPRAHGEAPLFETRVIGRFSGGASAVHAADLDGDGDLDVLGAAYDEAKIAWYENARTRSPVFAEHTITIEAEGVESIFAVDLDFDGDLDVISASSLDAKIVWYENDGRRSPSFTAHTISESAHGARSVHAADLDGDGDIDILSVSDEDDTIEWHENDGNTPPRFRLRVISRDASAPWSVHAVDLDRDGDIDVIVPARDDGEILWFENDGRRPPSFRSRAVASGLKGPRSARAADLDGDGDVDVVSGTADDGRVLWHENDGARPPSFRTHTIALASPAPLEVRVADFNRDGALDLLVVGFRAAWGVPFLSPESAITWYESDGARPPSFTAHILIRSEGGHRSLFAVDLDRDGRMDLLSALSLDNEIVWYRRLR